LPSSSNYGLVTTQLNTLINAGEAGEIPALTRNREVVAHTYYSVGLPGDECSIPPAEDCGAIRPNGLSAL